MSQVTPPLNPQLPAPAPTTTTFVSPALPDTYTVARYVMYSTNMVTVAPSSRFKLFAQSEYGDLLGFIFELTNPNAVVEVAISGDNDTFYLLNDLSVAEMVSQGRGVGAGDATNLPSGQAQDVQCTPNNVFPYVSRYKNDNVADFTGNPSPLFAVMYTPSVPIRYTGLTVAVRNGDTSLNATVNRAQINRIVYQQEKLKTGKQTVYQPFLSQGFKRAGR